ncbi:MAG: trypsin-like peptidase domain-containing protein [Magnetococcales bacterium]|nr:trypsin-like peptidase domain-containing protein [Magnetococcales bacterium]
MIRYLYLVVLISMVLLAASFWYDSVKRDKAMLAGGAPSANLQSSRTNFWDQFGLGGKRNQQGTDQAAMNRQQPLFTRAPEPIQKQTSPAAANAQPVAMIMAAQPQPNGNPFSLVAKNMMSSVVNVSASTAKPPATTGAATPGGRRGLRFASPFAGVATESIGSGVVITSDGYILTNFHVVENARQIHVTTFNRMGTKRYHADVIQHEPQLDLSLLKVVPDTPLKPAPLGNSNQVMVGDPVLAIGSPFGLDQTVSKGIISSKRKAVHIGDVVHRRLLQTDAAINRGNSGGPLVDGDGRVIGINTAIYTTTDAFAGVGFAVPMNHAKQFLENHLEVPEINPPRMTAQARQAAMTANGKTGTAPPIATDAVIAHDDRGPCQNCHVMLPPPGAPQQGQMGAANDANPQPVALRGGPRHMPRYQSRYQFSPGGAIGLPGAPFQGMGVALNQPAHNNANSVTPINEIGLNVIPLTKALMSQYQSPYQQGVLVRHADPGSASQRAGFKKGDIIFKVEGGWVTSPQNLQKRLSRFTQGEEMRFSVVRQGRPFDIRIKQPEQKNRAANRGQGTTVGNPQAQPVAQWNQTMPQTPRNLGTPTPPISTQPLWSHGGGMGWGPQGLCRQGLNGQINCAQGLNIATPPPQQPRQIRPQGQTMQPGLNRPPGAQAMNPGQGQMPRQNQLTPTKKAPPPPTEFEWMGMEMSPINAKAIGRNPKLKGKQGGLVSDIDARTAADKAGIRRNDIIRAMNGQMVTDARTLDKAIKSVKKGQSVLLVVERQGRQMYVTLQ